MCTIGQPTFHTHPHLLSAGELTPGFTSEEYARRRKNLAEKLPLNSVALLAAALPAHLANTHIPYPGYRQDADFAYLTGVLQPNASAMIERRPDGLHYTLFLPARCTRDEVWNGRKLSVDGALSFFGADAAYEFKEMSTIVESAVKGSSALFLDVDKRADAASTAAFSAALKAVSSGVHPRPLRPLVHSLRWRKSKAEMNAIRACVNTDVEGFRSAIKASLPGEIESTVAAHHEFQCKLLGADRLSYPSVVGGGPGALVVHYAEINRVLRAGELLLMDAGCERHGYVSDITRTWPIGPGGFSDAQADVYDAVLEAHDSCLRATKIGASLSDLHSLSVSVLSECLVNLGVGRALGKSNMVRSGTYMKYYPHSVAHWLGMDTHDTPTVATSNPLQPGCVFTIEPGLYFPEDDPEVPKGLRGIGVRIEDDIAVTLDGEVEILSGDLPVERSGIESLVRELRETIH